MNRQELRKRVPYGYGKIIARKAGVSQRAVSQFLSGFTNSERIELATLEVIAELNKKKKRLLEQIN